MLFLVIILFIFLLLINKTHMVIAKDNLIYEHKLHPFNLKNVSLIKTNYTVIRAFMALFLN